MRFKWTTRTFLCTSCSFFSWMNGGMNELHKYFTSINCCKCLLIRSHGVFVSPWFSQRIVRIFIIFVADVSVDAFKAFSILNDCISGFIDKLQSILIEKLALRVHSLFPLVGINSIITWVYRTFLVGLLVLRLYLHTVALQT